MSLCKHAQYLDGFLDGTLTTPEQSRIEAHLEKCTECQQALDALCSTSDSPYTSTLESRADEEASGWNANVARRMTEHVRIAAREAAYGLPNKAMKGSFDQDEVGETQALPEADDASLRSLADTTEFSDTQPNARSSAGEIPEEFGRYQIIKTLGRGGMGTVYLANDTELDRQIAIKVPRIHGDDQEGLDRFRREARSVAQIHHPNICPVYDVSQFEGTHYMTMAFIEGKPLSTYLQKGLPPKTKQTVNLIRVLAKALSHAHEAGIIHRDLKPANIMINKRGQPIIMDFGLARREGRDDTQLTKSGQIMGTPSFMPPEQVGGKIELMGPGCDVYSLGVILYQMLTGELPFQGDLLSVLSQIAMEKPKPPSATRPEIDGELDAICLKALEKQPQDRFQTMSEFAAALADYSKMQSQRSASQTATFPDGASILNPPSAAPTAPETKLPLEAKVSPRNSFVGANIKTLVLASGFFLALLFSVVLYFQFGRKTLKVIVHDPSLEVFFEHHELSISGERQESLTLKPGPEMITVTRGDCEFTTTNLTLKEGERATIEISYLEGTPTIKKNGERVDTAPLAPLQGVVVGEGSASSPAADRYPGPFALRVPERENGNVVVPSLRWNAINDLLQRGSSLTVEFWLKRDRFVIHAHDQFVGWDTSGGITVHSAAGAAYVEGGEQDGRGAEPIECRMARAPTRSQADEAVWMHVAAVLDQEKEEVRLFLNGELVDRKSEKELRRIGKDSDGAPPLTLLNKAVATIGETRVSTTARYDEEFTPQFRFKPDEHTLALYHFDEGEGNTLHDYSGNGHDGKIEGAEWLKSYVASSSSDVQLEGGLVGRWNFEESGERGISDSSGQMNHATFNSASDSIWSVDVPHSALVGSSSLVFRQDEGQVAVPMSKSLATTEAMTLACWCKVTPAFDATVLSHPSVTVRIQALKVLVHGYREGKSNGIELEPAAITPNRWLHVAVRLDGQTISLFVDGKQMTSQPCASPLHSGDGPMLIGERGDGNSRPTDEWVPIVLFDDVRIYNRALSDSEIIRLSEKVMNVP